MAERRWNARDRALVTVTFAMVILWVLIMFHVAQRDIVATADVAVSPGRPLDAVRREAPTFAEGEWCYLVTDRTSGASWWLVRLGGEWVALPVLGGVSPAADDLG